MEDWEKRIYESDAARYMPDAAYQIIRAYKLTKEGDRERQEERRTE